MEESLLKISGLKVSLNNGNSILQIIRGFDLELNRGEIVGILGESGSGKTVSSSMIARLFDSSEGKIEDGEIIFKGMNLVNMTEKDLNQVRGKQISYIFQNPSAALNPYKKIGRQLTDLMKNHKLDCSKKIILDAMTEVGLSEPEIIFDMYPFQLSGGQNQRIMICQSILCKPDLLIADEPTSSIDAMLRKKILDLLINVNKKYNMAIIFITHDFDIARYLCSRLLIMYGGMVVEEGGLEDILERPLHPYTEELIKCAGSLDSGNDFLYTLEGSPLIPSEFMNECPFISRCKYKIEECSKGIPDNVDMENRVVRCFVRSKKGDLNG